MTIRKLTVALIAGTAIAAAAAAYAHPGAWGAGGGYGPGANGCGYGPGMMGGYGPGMMGGYGPGMMGGYGPGMRGGHGPGMMGGFGPGMMGPDYQANAEGRLDNFKSYLGITAEQDGAWQKFAAKSKEQWESMRAGHEAMYSAMHDPKLTAPERAALRSQMMIQRAGSMEAMSTALKDLYAALTPEQRELIDQNGPGRRWRR